jgi:hypothetical protein
MSEGTPPERRPILHVPPIIWRVWFKADVKGRGGGYIDVTADEVNVYKGRAKVRLIERIDADA